MKKNILYVVLLLSASQYISAYSDGECMFGSVAGMAATVGLDHFYQKTTYPGWETWKILWNTLPATARDNWLGPTITLGWETIPELGGENKLYYVGRFFTYYSAYILTIIGWRYVKKHILESDEFADPEITGDEKAKRKSCN